jgi:hypothetical protein
MDAGFVRRCPLKEMDATAFDGKGKLKKAVAPMLMHGCSICPLLPLKRMDATAFDG